MNISYLQIKWTPWPKYYSVTTYSWAVCPVDGENRKCSNGLYFLSFSDHISTKYVNAIKYLANDATQSQKIIKEQCPPQMFVVP